MQSTGFHLGDCVRFQQLDGRYGIGLVLGQSNSLNPEGDREYAVIYRRRSGVPVIDDSVAACWTEHYSGHIDSELDQLFRLVMGIIKNNIDTCDFDDGVP